MIPWKELGRAAVPNGELILSQRGDEFVIRLRTIELMNSRAHHSEEMLAQLACANLPPGARVLVGGLGMGFTTRAALDLLPPDGSITVAELVPAVVEWNRGPLADLARRPLEDPRVSVTVGDVGTLIRQSRGAYHAILLDVDNGPDAFTSPTNASLYGVRGLERARAALVPGGMFAVWSAAPDEAFTGRLRGVGFRVETHKVPLRPGARARTVVWTAQASPLAAKR